MSRPKARSASAQHRVFEGLYRRDPQPRPRWNLDLRPGCGIASHPRLAAALGKNPDPGKAQFAFLLELLNDQRGKFVECGLRLLLADPDLVREISGNLRLRHHPPPCGRQATFLPSSVDEPPGFCK